MKHSTDLYLSYPTTFDPIPTINFRLKDRTKVSLSILDESKRLVKRIISEETLPEGFYSKPLMLTGLPRGVYFYALITDGGNELKKLIY